MGQTQASTLRQEKKTFQKISAYFQQANARLSLLLYFLAVPSNTTSLHGRKFPNLCSTDRG
jgi:hypothetical protein